MYHAPALEVQLERELDQTRSNTGSRYPAKRSIRDCRIRIRKLWSIEGVEKPRAKFYVGTLRGPARYGAFDQSKVEVALIRSPNDAHAAVTEVSSASVVTDD